MSTLTTKKQNEKKKDQDYPLEHVPMEARKGLVPIACVLVGFTFFTPTMASGAQLGAAFSFNELLLIITAGSLILGVYVATMCYIGAKTGLTAVLSSKYTFGTIGAKWSDLMLGGTQVFWYGITAEYMGQLFATALGFDGEGWKIFFIIVWGIIFGFSALYGVKMMAIVSYVAIPAMGVLMILVFIMAIKEAGSLEAIQAIQPTSEMTVASAITVIVGTFASGGTQASNWSRFAKSGVVAFVAGLIGFLIGNGIMIFSGMLGGLVFQTGDLIELMISMGLIFWALIILTLNIWTTNNATAYAVGMAGAEFFNKDNKTPFIIGGTVIAVVMACAGVTNVFLPMLGLLGTFVPPIGGAIMGDYFFVYKQKLPKIQYVKFKAFRWPPLVAYIIGCAVAYITGVYNIGCPALQGIVVTIILVPIINKIFAAMGGETEHEVAEGVEYI